MNIVYIRAAILAKTGRYLTLKEVLSYLVEEGLLTNAKAKKVIFPGFSLLYQDKGLTGNPNRHEDIELPVDMVIRD